MAGWKGRRCVLLDPVHQRGCEWFQQKLRTGVPNTDTPEIFLQIMACLKECFLSLLILLLPVSLPTLMQDCNKTNVNYENNFEQT